MDATYAQRVGGRLRKIRLQKGLSLHEVEMASSQEFKASVLGAYERGERSISVPRLQRLAGFYRMPVDHLLPKMDEEPTTTGGGGDRVSIDLVQLESVETPEKPVIQRYLNLVQMQRGDFNGKVLTIRSEDLRAIASVLDVAPDQLPERLDSMGIRASAAS